MATSDVQADEEKTYGETLVQRLWGWQEATLDHTAKRVMVEAAMTIEQSQADAQKARDWLRKWSGSLSNEAYHELANIVGDP